LAKRNTPSYWWKINAVHMGVMRRPLEQPLQLSSRCTGGDTSPCRAASNVTAPLGNSAHGQKFPVPANRNSLFPDGTGNWLQAIEFALRSAPKNRAKRPEFGGNFQNFPVIFPVLRECAAQAVSSLDTPSHPDD